MPHQRKSKRFLPRFLETIMIAFIGRGATFGIMLQFCGEWLQSDTFMSGFEMRIVSSLFFIRSVVRFVEQQVSFQPSTNVTWRRFMLERRRMTWKKCQYPQTICSRTQRSSPKLRWVAWDWTREGERKKASMRRSLSPKKSKATKSCSCSSRSSSYLDRKLHKRNETRTSLWSGFSGPPTRSCRCRDTKMQDSSPEVAWTANERYAHGHDYCIYCLVQNTSECDGNFVQNLAN